MKRLLSALTAILVLLSFAACASAPAVEQPAATLSPTTIEPTSVPTQEPTPEPTAVPTPAPTPEPVFTETVMSEKLFTSGDVAVIVTGVRFSENYMAYIDLSVENGSKSSVSLLLGGVCLNDWQVDGTIENAANIAPDETRTASVVLRFLDDPNAVYLNIASIAGVTLGLSVLDDESGEALLKPKSFSVSVPNATPVSDPSENTTLVYEDNHLAIFLQNIDGSLKNTRALLYKKPKATWMSVTVDPVYAGYTNIVNQTYTMEPGKYRLLSLDGTEVMTRQNITALSQLDLYLTLHHFDGRILRPVIATIVDPNVSQTVLSAPDAGPIVYQSELSYFILRNMGITQFDGHEAVLLDFENITQNYIKTLDITAYASNPKITIDGTAYPLATYSTNCYPTTHGYLLLWPEGAPEGTLSSATSVTVGLKIARINAGRLDPIVDTHDFTFDLVK